MFESGDSTSRSVFSAVPDCMLYQSCTPISLELRVLRWTASSVRTRSNDVAGLILELSRSARMSIVELRFASSRRKQLRSVYSTATCRPSSCVPTQALERLQLFQDRFDVPMYSCMLARQKRSSTIGMFQDGSAHRKRRQLLWFSGNQKNVMAAMQSGRCMVGLSGGSDSGDPKPGSASTIVSNSGRVSNRVRLGSARN